MILFMNKKNLISLLLILIVLGIYLYFREGNNNKNIESIDLTHYPIYQSKEATMYIYGFDGKLKETIFAKDVEYFEQNSYTLFQEPVVHLYNEALIPEWRLTSNDAKLINNNDLDLNGKVVIDNLLKESDIKKIITYNAKVNLNSLIATSQERVTAYGTNLETTGIGVKSYLKTRKTDILNDVKTRYGVSSIENNE